MRRLVRGLDEMALEIGFVTLSVLLGLAVLWFALNSRTAGRLQSVPFIGQIVGGVQSVVNLVVHP